VTLVAGLPCTKSVTIDWGVGYIDFFWVQFSACYRSVSVVEYAGGDPCTEESMKKYIYGRQQGLVESIGSIHGDVSTGGDDNDDTAPTTSIHHSSTSHASVKLSATSNGSTTTGVFSLIRHPSTTLSSHANPTSMGSENSRETSDEPAQPNRPPSPGALANVAPLSDIAFAGLSLLVNRAL
jgi:hypothetical protein